LDIQDWDTISIIDVSSVNAQLRASLNKLIDSFDYQGTSAFGGSYTVSGEFGPWQVSGGSDQLLNLDIPILKGTLSAGGRSTDLAGMTATVEVTLNLLPSPINAKVMELRFDFRVAGSKNSPAVPGLVRPISCSDPKNTGQSSYVMDAVANVLVHNASEVSYVFAEIGLVDLTIPSWLTPVRSRYSYQQPAGGKNGYLGVFSVTSDRDVSGLSTQIGSDLVSLSYPWSFLISGPLFLEHVILPMLPAAFPGTDTTYFAFSNNTISITKPVNLQAVEPAGIPYTPVVQTLALTIDDNKLSNSTSGTVDLHMPNASMSFSISTHDVLQYTASTNSFSFLPDPSPVTQSQNNIPWYDYLLVGLAAVISLAIFPAVINAVANDVANAINSGDVGGQLNDAPPKVVAWNGMDAMTVRDAGLSTAFWLRATAG
jgi:P-47 protein